MSFFRSGLALAFYLCMSSFFVFPGGGPGLALFFMQTFLSGGGAVFPFFCFCMSTIFVVFPAAVLD